MQHTMRVQVQPTWEGQIMTSKSLANYAKYQEAELAEARTEPNPFGINPWGNCPVQAEGQLSKKEHYYFRARHEHWSFTIAATEKDAIEGNDKALFSVYSRWGKDDGAGYMRKATAIRLITLAVELYRLSKASAV